MLAGSDAEFLAAMAASPRNAGADLRKSLLPREFELDHVVQAWESTLQNRRPRHCAADR